MQDENERPKGFVGKPRQGSRLQVAGAEASVKGESELGRAYRAGGKRLKGMLDAERVLTRHLRARLENETPIAAQPDGADEVSIWFMREENFMRAGLLRRRCGRRCDPFFRRGPGDAMFRPLIVTQAAGGSRDPAVRRAA